MADQYIRIFEGPERESNIVGLSASNRELADHPHFKRFFADKGYTATELEGVHVEDDGSQFWRNHDRVPSYAKSRRFVEIFPPFSDESLQEFGALCVGGIINGQMSQGLVDPSQNSVFIYDNRAIRPDSTYNLGVLVANS